jgi:hypothetical protein
VVRPGAEKIVVLSIVLAIGFAIGMYLFVDSRIKASREAALRAAAVAETKHTERTAAISTLDRAAVVASSFVAHLGAGRFADAHALLAAPYRDAVSPSAFEKACRASPILASARSVRLTKLRQQSAGAAASIEASGVLESGAGAVPINFVFLAEAQPDGAKDPRGALRILVVSLAGVPVLQGVTAR